MGVVIFREYFMCGSTSYHGSASYAGVDISREYFMCGSCGSVRSCGSTSNAGVSGVAGLSGVAGVPDLQDMKKLTQMIDANLITSLVLGEGLLPTPH